MQKIISATEIVDKYGISYQTVNYYTCLGLLVVVRVKGNKRLYDKEDVEERLKRIDELKKRGYPLKVIRQELSKKL